jgi:hypothetical protein
MMSPQWQTLIAQLESYVQTTRAQLAGSPDQEHYWRGVLFGLELAWLEAHKQQALDEPHVDPGEPAHEELDRLIFDHLEHLIALCEARIRRELLVYNARVTRYELLKAVRRQTRDTPPSDYERRADPGVGGTPAE